MKRFGRHLFNGAIVLSLVLCFGMAGLWVRGRYWSDTVGWAGWKDQAAGVWRGWGFISRDGGMTAYYFEGKMLVYSPTSIGTELADSKSKPGFVHQVSGASPGSSRMFRWETINPGWPVPFWFTLIRAPLWLFIVVFGIGPIWRGFVIWRRWVRGRISMGFEVKLLTGDRVLGS